MNAAIDIDQLLHLARSPTGLADLFNPYRDRRPAIDRPDAAAIRRRNLRRYLETIDTSPNPMLWMAEAPGSLGGACSGVPLVPEGCFDRFAARTGIELERATTGPAPTTRTAEAVWQHIEQLESLPLLWNTVLHHPHQPGRPLTNRTPRRAEIDAFAHARQLVASRSAIQVLAIGRVAHRALGDNATYVRHPAQGGRTQFDDSMALLLQLTPPAHTGTHPPAR